jgi:undecaprenyl-diphosphatase
MNYPMVKSIFVKHKNIFIVIMAITVLTVLSIISFLFWDTNIFTWQRQNLDHFEKSLFVKGLVQLGKAWLLIWLLLCWVLLTKCRQKALIAMIALFLLIFTVLPLKIITHRPRPYDVIKNYVELNNGADIFRSWSFPSGDTASAFAVAAAIFPFISWFGRSITFSLAGCIGVLRVVSFSHYLSDIFAGAAVGVIVAYLAYRLVISKSLLRKKLLNLLNTKFVLAAIIIIPVMSGISNGMDDLFTFSIFYPPLVIVLYLLSKINRLHLLYRCF